MLTELHLQYFRNHTEGNFNFAPLTIITGKNGSGKTSILEAIAMLSVTTSWKAEKDSEVVQWNQPFSRIVSQEKELVIQQTPYLKRMRIDGVSKRTHQVVGYFPTVLFQPDDLQLLYGSPTFRRHYLDRVLSQCNNRYTQAIVRIQHILKQRNRLLKNIQEGIAQSEELYFWDTQLDEVQGIIQPLRKRFIEYLNLTVPPLFEEMVPEGMIVHISYHKSPSQSHGDSVFLESLAANRNKEIAAGVTLYGPHREDIEVKWGEYAAAQSMSRGQSRSLLVAFKIAELQFITQETEKKPVLLLDDIFSELDAERRTRLFSIFGHYQVVMTTTELGMAQEALHDQATVIKC